ncbi:MAG: B12-binding domain-containing radical SAM protein [Pirellulaceae bacterium]|jgi:radical SAM superfamily enzyme YgiQ (UPF0313 family)|nr:B12-binding domain-containing radical SAM protein [Pirellulaceae bacterium]
MTTLKPTDRLHCLLVQPKFEESNFWNFVEGARAIGAKATAPPLGLLTVAAMLPEHWELRVADLNVAPLGEADLAWADMVCTGGMLPQQPGTMRVIELAQQQGKYVVVGGPDPTSQPDLYTQADALVLGEGESSIPVWLRKWEAGDPCGRFEPDATVDITTTPIPRWDLISFSDYLHAGMQSSRGCPYNCEFCDVIELFGRKPRVKTPEQFVAELQRLYDLGYRGWVDIADDNFIGNRQKIKPVLQATADWMRQHKYPFVLSTEASVNLADDDELLSLMNACQFRYVFLGIETPDHEVLAQTQKRINTVRPLIERIHRIYAAGISVTAGFIIGFDSEPTGVDEKLIPFIRDSGISLAMVGLLTALPNTQLTRRLGREGRLISTDHRRIESSEEDYRLRISVGVDQTIGGLNFVTVRDRVEIYQELSRVITDIYSPSAFMSRVLDTARRLDLNSRHQPNAWEWRRMLRGFAHVSWSLTMNRRTRWHYLKTAWKAMWLGFQKFEFAHTTLGAFLHFHRQAEAIQLELKKSIEYAQYEALYPRSVGDMRPAVDAVTLPVLPVESC